jgi:putative Mg2+ transporter-C (MgtC) family protein
MAFAFEIPDEALVRLLVAVVLGAAVGIEREVNDQPAGLRTHIAICLGASIFGIVSTLGFDEFVVSDRNSTNVNVDVTRVASQVVVGIGFLGAGVIFRRGNVIKNLTTGASLWTVAAIGLAAGVGDITMAAIATAVLLVSLVVLRPVRTFVRRRFGDETHDLHVKLTDRSAVSRIVELLNTRDDVELVLLEIEQDDDERTVVAAQVRSGDQAAQDAVVALSALDVVTEVREERGAT